MAISAPGQHKSHCMMRILFPIFGDIILHLAGTCVSSVLFIFLHHKNNFNANPKLALDHLEALVSVSQWPMFLGVILGVMAAFIDD